MKPEKMKAEAPHPDDDWGVWLNIEIEGGSYSSINPGHADEPIALGALDAGEKEVDPACTPVPHMPATPVDLEGLTDIELIIHYEKTAPDDPQGDRISDEMEVRGLDYPGILFRRDSPDCA